MYLLVFVTLVVALTGIYAEVITLQTRQLYSHQTTIAAAMEQWHATAVAQARYAGLSPPGAAGCDLTTGGILGDTCHTPAGVNVTVDGQPPGLTLCGNGATTDCWTNLPPGYQVPPSPYKFYSIYYQPVAGQNLVVTFVPPPSCPANPPPDNIILLPGTCGTQIGITPGELFQQIKNSGMSIISYGTVATVGGQNIVMTPAISNGAQSSSYSYSLPVGPPCANPLGCVPVNSIAIVSSM